MALLGVTELMTDPDFVDKMQVITRIPSITSGGENILLESSIFTVGSIQPADGRTINKIPESLRVENLSSFWFRGTIIASAPGLYPSILVFNYQRYQVKHIFDWSNFGAGYTEGVCVQQTVAP
jgi:hypothetical protein